MQINAKLAVIIFTVILSITATNVYASTGTFLSLDNNPKFANYSSGVINEMFNSEGNVICEKLKFKEQVIDPKCYAVATVMYESNSTVVLFSEAPSYAGASIDLLKSEGYELKSFSRPHAYDDNYTLVFTKTSVSTK